MSILKEIAEALKEGIDEGIAEAKQEIKEDKKEIKEKQFLNIENKILSENELKENLRKITYREQFLMGVAAPLRAEFFDDWNLKYFPLHLFTFDSENLLTLKEKRELKKILKRDFQIIDKKTFYINAGVKWDTINNNIYEYSDEKKAYECCTLAYMITSSADVEYISKNEAMEWAQKVSFAVRYLCMNSKENSWKKFAKLVSLGREEMELFSEKQNKSFNEYINYLQEDNESPWNMISFDVPLSEIEKLNKEVFICKHSLEENSPVTFIYHKHDGNWQFLCDKKHSDDDNLIKINLKKVLELYPNLIKLIFLPKDFYALLSDEEKDNNTLIHESKWNIFYK